jgi:hypothetical protein
MSEGRGQPYRNRLRSGLGTLILVCLESAYAGSFHPSRSLKTAQRSKSSKAIYYNFTTKSLAGFQASLPKQAFTEASRSQEMRRLWKCRTPDFQRQADREARFGDTGGVYSYAEDGDGPQRQRDAPPMEIRTEVKI